MASLSYFLLIDKILDSGKKRGSVIGMSNPELTPPPAEKTSKYGTLSPEEFEAQSDLFKQVGQFGPTTIQPGDRQPVTMRGHDGQRTVLESEDAAAQRVLREAEKLAAGLKVHLGSEPQPRKS